MSTETTAPPPLSAGCAAPSGVHDVALLDLDGVVYVGRDAVPRVPEALRAARDAGMRLAYVTNNAARTPEEVAAHLCDLGIEARPEEVITSSQAAATVVGQRLGADARVLAVGGPGVSAAARAAGLTVVTGAHEAPDAVVQGYGPDVGWADLAEAVVAVRGGAVHVATNTDATIPSPRGVLPGNGALVGVVSTVTGRAPLVAGKPDPAMHAECVRRTGARRPLVVGDRLDTDIEGSRRAGADSLLVLSGVTTPATLLAAVPLHRPDLLSADASGVLTAHPPVLSEDGGRRCGRWLARVATDELVLSAALDVPDLPDDAAGVPDDGLDALRALCVAHWARHPEAGQPTTVRGSDDATWALVRGWGLASG
ncbi:HAD-IIA family hydrolase [Modestobacter sp. I12A-02628]|uniref:HAD-IIA family hydrolase n=1 Tax=Goekera deserti TaxID=2497753 RepID=A0A7K3WEK7_9ACTN|nr:HAD-IIA family hydrolase [Goekera deserti]MPQ99763.1 HAD-IIA family hydrolase [Goekera deserti]NDI46226.1 HAD-IIA family hydrolase [Goekera deserti]NEL54842.1 HAD-IIA family hydrolase [Goekera deserti]